MKINEISVQRRTRASAGVFRIPEESINVGRSVRSIQITIRSLQIEIAMFPMPGIDLSKCRM
jgi:hypothetical protein